LALTAGANRERSFLSAEAPDAGALYLAVCASSASDSKHFGAWDQNLTTQWHVRYGGRGVTIYWHVERNSLCIHSQLKSPSSSEVASMIEGVLRHCTEMAVDRILIRGKASLQKNAIKVCLNERLPCRLERYGGKWKSSY
jgi:TnpA family transposase